MRVDVVVCGRVGVAVASACGCACGGCGCGGCGGGGGGGCVWRRVGDVYFGRFTSKFLYTIKLLCMRRR